MGKTQKNKIKIVCYFKSLPIIVGLLVDFLNNK